MGETVILSLLYGIVGGMIGNYLVALGGFKTIKTNKHTISIFEGRDSDIINVVDDLENNLLLASFKKTKNGLNYIKHGSN